MKFTDFSIAKLDPGTKAEVWRKDERLTGYAVRARRLSDGTVQKTFFVTYQIRDDNGVRKTVKVQVGVWKNPLTEADAREEARRLLAQRARGHRMVSGKTAARGERLVSDLVEQFLSDHVVRKKPNTASEYTRVLRKHIKPALGHLPVVAVQRADLRDWHRTFATTPSIGNRCLAVASRMFSFAVEREWRSDNPAQGVRKNPERKRTSWLDATQLPKFLAALNRRDGPHAELLRFLTLSGWRVMEGIGLRWDEVDLPQLIAHLSDTKTGRSTRALSADAAQLISRQEHRVGFVFSGSAGAEPCGYTKLREVLAQVCQEAHIVPAVTAHALRRTAAAHAAVAGASTIELMRTFGWKTPAMASRYVQSAEELSRAGAERTAGAINIFQRPSAEVKRLRGEKI